MTPDAANQDVGDSIAEIGNLVKTDAQASWIILSVAYTYFWFFFTASVKQTAQQQLPAITQNYHVFDFSMYVWKLMGRLRVELL